MQIDLGQRLLQLTQLHPDPFAVDDQQRRTELLDQAADLFGLKWIDKRVVRERSAWKVSSGEWSGLGKHGVGAGVIAFGDPGRGTLQTIADRIPAFALGHVLDQDLLATGRIECPEVGVQIMGVLLGTAPGVHPGHIGVRLERQSLGQHGDTLATRRGHIGLRINLAGGTMLIGVVGA